MEKMFNIIVGFFSQFIGAALELPLCNDIIVLGSAIDLLLWSSVGH